MILDLLYSIPFFFFLNQIPLIIIIINYFPLKKYILNVYIYRYIYINRISLSYPFFFFFFFFFHFFVLVFLSFSPFALFSNLAKHIIYNGCITVFKSFPNPRSNSNTFFKEKETFKTKR